MCELNGVFFPQAIGGAGDDCPGAFLAIFAELRSISISLSMTENRMGWKRRGEAKRTLFPLSTNKLASNRT